MAGHSQDEEESTDRERRTFLKTVGASSLAASATMLAGCGGQNGSGGGSGSGGSSGGGSGGSSGGGSGGSGGDGGGDGGGDDGDGGGGGSGRAGGSLAVAIPTSITGIPGTLHSQFIAGGGSDVTQKLSPVWSDRLVEWRNGELVPGLATDWSVENDGRTVVFQLREGVTFHDGSEFTADDLVYTYEWAWRKDVLSNLTEYFSYIDDPEAAIEKRGDYEVAFTSPEYQASFLGDFGRTMAYPVPEGAYDDVSKPSDYGQIPENPPISTGPFKFEESVGESSLTFTSHDDYWKTDDDGNSLPYLDEVQIQLTQSPQPRYTGVSTGDVDVAASIPTNRVSDMQTQQGVQPVVRDGARALRLVFNHPQWDPVQPDDMTPPPEGCPIPENLGATEDAVKFKQGVMYAINAEPINNALMTGLAAENHAHMPPWHAVYQQADEEGVLNEYEYDPERAQQLFNESIGDPSSIGTWNAITEQEVQRDHTALAILQQQLGEMGFDLNPQPLLRPEGFANWEWGGEESETRSATCPTTPPDDQHTNLYGIDVTTPDPLSWLGPTRWDAGVRQNRSHYVAASDMVNEMANTRDPDQRREQQVEILAKLNQDVAHGIIMWFPRTWARRNHVRNVRVTPYQNYWFTETWVDE